jgi:hypothetical protein
LLFWPEKYVFTMKTTEGDRFELLFKNLYAIKPIKSHANFFSNNSPLRVEQCFHYSVDKDQITILLKMLMVSHGSWWPWEQLAQEASTILLFVCIFCQSPTIRLDIFLSYYRFFFKKRLKFLSFHIVWWIFWLIGDLFKVFTVVGDLVLDWRPVS